MVKVGIIGIGFMGVTHFKALQQVKGARVTAISTRDPKKLNGDWRSIKGNFGDAGGQQDLAGIARYAEIDDLLADPNIDLVNICLPTHLHRAITIQALQTGKHVLVEKPIALTLKDADAMIAAATKAKRLLMVGQVLRFFPAFAEAHALVQSGKYGALRGAHLKRIISTPRWAADDHFEDISKSGGPALDLHIHDTDFVHYVAGVPQRVQSTGVVAKNGAITYLQTQYLYAGGGPCITCQSGAIATPSLMFEHGYDIYLEKATLQYNNLFTGDDIWLYPEKGQKRVLRPRRKEAFVAQLQHATECVAANRESDIIAAPLARQALAVCLQEQKSVLTGKAVNIKS
ncbi:MAG: Gfo/Idh/MocA family oxidoreductase [Abitibacteriaceae bacterium]|nr:Gfo/Idh/MocA family oxidoreductase [Abditibacteriaceae bacterium]